MTLEPIWGTWGDFDTNAVLSLYVGENVDLYFTCSWSANEYNQFSREGYYVRLDDPENNLLQNRIYFTKIMCFITKGNKIVFYVIFVYHKNIENK